MTRIAEEKFAVTGLSPSHAFLIMTINDKPGIQPKEISEMMQLTPSTITRLVDKMEQKGLLERKLIGKYSEIHPTQAGIELNQGIKTAWMSLYEQYTSCLGNEESKLLTQSIYNAAFKLDT
jgi:DNA-binding MarR family transcriptional regulator